MFKLFKKEEETNHDIVLLDIIVNHCNSSPNNSWTTSYITNSDWKSIRFLNKRGLVKYYKTDRTNVYTISLTLFCFYLTRIKKYDIARVYSEATKLYNFIGESKNGIQARRLLP